MNQKLALLWAGITLGGSLLAGPAKFQVADLTLPVGLQVGRVQFLWVLYGELVCLLLLLIGFVVGRKSHSARFPFWLAIVIILLAIQHLGLMPLLQERSERIIAGQPVKQSHLHLVYICLETAKFFLLLVVGFGLSKGK